MVSNISSGTIGHLCNFFREMSVQILSPFHNWVVCFCCCWVVRVICTFWILILVRYDLWIFPPFCGLLLDSTDSVLWCTKVSNVVGINLSTFSFVGCDFGVIAKKPSPNPKSSKFSFIFSKSFRVLALMCRSSVPFELICHVIWGKFFVYFFNWVIWLFII